MSKNFSETKRKRIFIRDNGCCRLCGKKLTLEFDANNWDDYANLDHIIPKSQGGKNTDENLRILCRSCNSGRRYYSGDKLIELIEKNIEKSSLEKYKVKLIDDVNNKILTNENIQQLINYQKKVYEDNIVMLMNLLNEDY